MTDRVGAVAEKVLQMNQGVKFGEYTSLPEGYMTYLMRNELALDCLRQDLQSSVRDADGYEVWLHYNGEPVVYPDVGKTLGVRVLKDNELLEFDIELEAPGGWKVTKLPDAFDQKRFLVETSKFDDRNELSIRSKGLETRFAILGPAEARGYPSGSNVPVCPVCHGYLGHCACDDGK